jgi:RimJ/RimL family protein N-acetyltransferase
MEPVPIETVRLRLPVLEVGAIDALIAGDASRLESLTGATFPRPLQPPPLMDDALPFMRDKLREAPAEAAWWARLIVLRATGEAVGSLGYGGPPDAEGVVVVGYSVYPAFRGRGYASEALPALVEWALAQPGVRRVRAIIPPDNTPSFKVAEHAGLRPVGTAHDDEVGEVLAYEIAVEDGAPRTESSNR